MDIGRAIQYWLNDPDWIKKVLVGGILMIVPIIGWLIVAGFYIRTVKTISSGADVPLPEWGQWGDDLVRGFKLAIVIVVWLIPIWILSACVVALSLADDAAGSLAGLLLNCFVLLYSVAFYFIYPILIAKFAQNEDVSTAFQIGSIIQDAQKIPTQLLIFVVIYFVVGFVAGFGIILCVVGVFFTGFIAYLISAHLVAQIAGMLGYANRPPDPMAPPPAAV